jgi:hypothetical protein
MKTRDKIYRIIAAYLLLNLLAEYFMPIAAHALTGGPSQPEVESFEPIGTTEMVDMFTGDFNYNIPLMTVPGPNGGYPLNLAYHAGIGMEQEASWCGLGWNINAGVINRMLRGLPDDFNGATIEKQYQAKPNNTLGIGMKGPSEDELFGFDIGGVYGQLYYNNYKGVGYQVSMSLASEESNSNGSGWNNSLSLSLSSESGLGINPDFSYGKKYHGHQYVYHLGVGYNSKEGFTGISLRSERYSSMRYAASYSSASREKGTANSQDSRNGHSRTQSNFSDGTIRFTGLKNHSDGGSGVCFNSPGYVPNVSGPVHGMNLRFALSFGSIEIDEQTIPFSYSDHPDLPPPADVTIDHLFKSLTIVKSWGLKPGLNYNASLSLQWSPKDPIGYDAYGYLNTQSAGSNDMLDFNREKDVPPTKDLPSLPVPVYTYDSYVIKGQGIGGVFRPYRNDVSVLHDPNMGYTIPTLILDGEVAADPEIEGSHWGVGAGVGITSVQSGNWSYKDETVNYFGATTTNVATPLYEPVFFRSAGDQSENIPFTDYAGGDRPARFDVGFGFAGISLHPMLKNKLVDKDANYITPSTKVKKLNRDKRNQSIEYFTNAQLNLLNVFPFGSARVYAPNKFPVFDTDEGSDYSDFTYSHDEFTGSAYSDQLGAMSVLNPDGNRYYYALPAYNKTQKEVVCSVDNAIPIDAHSATASYGSSNNVNNNKGEDHLYNSVTTPAYAHSYLLTAVIGADYVDLTGDGPSDDDLGYWVKFNYSKVSDYNWRTPYASGKGNLMGAYVSNEHDDKVSYVYGEKELFYLNSIETKTHVACCFLNDDEHPRKDARGVNDEDNSTPLSGAHQYRLEKIELYSKRDIAADPANARSIKTVNLTYDYSLCKSVENNLSGDEEDGKLTLTEVSFSYLGNTKGALSPYHFDYHQGVDEENPDYSLADMDRWGNYQKEDGASGVKRFNSENPYTNQETGGTSEDDRADRAGAWSLKGITLPSGGHMDIQYESDDYAYVQDKRAMQMTKIVGTYDGTGTDTENKIDKDHLKIAFELDEPICTTDVDALDRLQQYGEGIDKLYFKVFEKLKRYYPGLSGDDYACDYIEGYATVVQSGDNPSMGFVQTASCTATVAWIEVAPEKVTNSPLEVRETHPFRKAGWQYLRMQRPDLFGPSNDFGGAAFTLNPTIQAVQQIMNMVQALSGYYDYCWIRGFCKELVLAEDNQVNYRPSYIRLNSADYIKYGGGHRVKQITLSDGWSEMVDAVTPDHDGNENDTQYGQTFSYTMPDGTSSGVAEYEPLVGGEEIPHHLPVPYSTSKFLSNDKALFIEEPYGESMFPPANVGYRRVVVKNIEKENVTKNREGQKVFEFYTAKEFPVRVDKTEDVLQRKYWLPLPIPFLGSMSFNNRGYSQGYTIELNDMHGKPRSIATYSSNANVNDAFTQPVTKIDYVYNTENPFTTTAANYLNNTVTVLDGDGNYRDGELGLITEMYIDKSERYSTNTTFSLDPNFDVAGAPPAPPVASFSLVPSLEISEAEFRSAVTVKVLQRTGVLMETKAFDQGSMAVTKNLMFDALTGVPLLTEVNNNFDKPVYSYSYAAHWAYEGMADAAQNWGAVFDVTVSGGSGEADYSYAEQFFNVGDELVDLGTSPWNRYWVENITTTASTPASDNIKIVDEYGADISNGNYHLMVIRSGRRNQQALTNGTIVSLSNPVTERSFPLFTALNSWLAADADHGETEITYERCADGQSETVDLSVITLNNSLGLSPDGAELCSRVQLPADFDFDALSDLYGYTFTKMGNDVKIYNALTGDLMWGTWVAGSGNCFEECIPDVLHADATRFTDRWNYFYADLGDPFEPVSGTYNEYRQGLRGVWRSETSHLYQVDRKQSTPLIDVDGTYNHFVPYNWGIDGAANNRWSLASRTTLYSPFGFALEERDTINVYSSAIYGYDNSLSTAVSANSQYFESGFDGFEDYYSGYPQVCSSCLSPVPLGHGHFLFKTGALSYPSLGAIGHTGDKSMQVAYGSPATFSTTAVTDHSALSSTTTKFTPIAGKEYAFSCWVKNPADPYVGGATVAVKINGSTISTYTTSKTDVIIEGWHQVNITIPAMSSTNTLDIVVTSTTGGSTIYVDDVRIVPFKGAIKTYVYDPVTLWLVAELDNRNFATFYNYDEEGALVQVKKETTNGIITVRSSRNNISR